MIIENTKNVSSMLEFFNGVSYACIQLVSDKVGRTEAAARVTHSIRVTYLLHSTKSRRNDLTPYYSLAG